MARVSKRFRDLSKEITKRLRSAQKNSGDAELARNDLLAMSERVDKARANGTMSAKEHEKLTDQLWEAYQGIPEGGRDRMGVGDYTVSLDDVMARRGVMDESDAATGMSDDILEQGVAGEVPEGMTAGSPFDQGYDYFDPDADTIRAVADEEMAGMDAVREMNRRAEFGVEPMPPFKGPYGKLPGELGYQYREPMRSVNTPQPSSYKAPNYRTGKGGSTEPVTPSVQASTDADVNFRATDDPEIPRKGLIQNVKGANKTGTTKFRDLRRRGAGAAAATAGLAAASKTNAAGEAGGLGQGGGVLENVHGLISGASDMVMGSGRMAVDIAQDMGSQALSGLSGLGTMAMGGALDGAVSNVETVRDATAPEMGEMPGMDPIVDQLAKHPEMAEKILRVLERLEGLDQESGDAIFNATGSPGAAAAGKTVVRGALELL